MSEDFQKKALSVSYAISFGFALLLALSFFFLSRFVVGDNAVAQYGGAAWVLLLSLIVALPLITAVVKKRMRRD